ncbi:MAG: hypothetical protein DCF32_10675 [Leptolyngbya sp.]|nr:MAG: hypothetical protein DCF32_10675 [Leptolyngbya sp.]
MLLDEILSEYQKSEGDDSALWKERSQFVARSLRVGGAEFVAAARQYGRTDRGQELDWPVWFEQLLLAIGDFRLQHTLTTGPSQIGKAQPLDAKVLTPTGWRLMGELIPGDQVIAADGTPSTVIAVYPQGLKDIYRVSFDDGSSAECCDDHLWYTQTASDRGVKAKPGALKPRGTRQRGWEFTEYGDRPGTVKSLREIRDTLYIAKPDGSLSLFRGKPRSNHSIPLVKPVEMRSQPLPVQPYTLGVLLGDGSLSTGKSVGLSTADLEVVDQVRAELPPHVHIKKKDGENCDYVIRTDWRGYNLRRHGNPLVRALRGLDVLGKKAEQKRIPEQYLNGNAKQRLALLRGLMDTDGEVNKAGSTLFSSVSYGLVRDVQALVWSLGGRAGEIRPRQTYYTHNGDRRAGQPSYQLCFRLPVCPVTIPRKVERWRLCHPKTFRRFIRDIQPVGQKPAQCILIDHPSHLYVTDDWIVTHNTLPHNLLNAYCLTVGRLNTFTVYDLERTLHRNVPLQFKPTLARWMAEAGLSVKGGQANAGDRTGLSSGRSQNNTLVQVNDGNAMFGFASTSAEVRGDRTAAAGSSVISLTADILFMDERSKFAPGSAGPLVRRLDASILPTRPIRELGTPGGGSGIEAVIRTADYHFYPHYCCPACAAIAPLDPKGCLLKPFDTADAAGNPVIRYLSESGRPIAKTMPDGRMEAYWHHHDPYNAIATAYFGCSRCGAELSGQVRSLAWMQCLKTGIRLLDFLDSLPVAPPWPNHRVAFHLTPLTRDRETNEAERLIFDGINTANPTDWQQQGLGHQSEESANSVPFESIRAAIDGARPTGDPDFVLAGVDQGRGEDWLWVCAYHLPPGWRGMKTELVIQQTLRHVLFGGDIMRAELSDRLELLGVTFGLVDNEPDRSDAAWLCTQTPLEMADQRGTLSDAVKRGKVKDGGEVLDSWFIRNGKFLKQVLTSFLTLAPDGAPLYRLPPAWSQWLSNTSSERSPIRHLMAPSHDPSTGEWFRGEGNVDDIYYAAMFCEAAFYIKLATGNRNPAARMPYSSRIARRPY